MYVLSTLEIRPSAMARPLVPDVVFQKLLNLLGFFLCTTEWSEQQHQQQPQDLFYERSQKRIDRLVQADTYNHSLEPR